jgi:hypothetical protein
MNASIYMTLSLKIEKIGIHSVVVEISSWEVEGGKIIIYKSWNNLSTCRFSTN